MAITSFREPREETAIRRTTRQHVRLATSEKETEPLQSGTGQCKGIPMTETLVKIRFELDGEEWHGHGTETLWAMPIAGSQRRLFQLKNSPFYVRGISHLDIVRATPTEGSRGMFDFVEVIERGGHSTYMLLIPPDDPRRGAYWNLLQGLGCSYEGAELGFSFGKRLLYSVDVPPTTDLNEVREVLDKGESDGVWMYQDGYVSNPASPPKAQ
jgi:hypothetical protein